MIFMKKSKSIPSKMHALVLNDVGKLEYQEVNNYKLVDDAVIIKVKYCSICSSDIERVFVTGTYHFPTIPGHEIAGEIVCVNEKDKDLLGKKVAVFPMLPCMKCDACKLGEYAQCTSYNYFGSRCDGGFAEYLLVPKWNLVFLPDEVTCRVACLCEPSAVSLHAVNILSLKKGESVAVSGTGTIAFLIAYFAKKQGGVVTIVGRNNKKLKIAKELGYNILNIKDIKNNVNSFDKVIEAVGTNDSINNCLELVNTFGTVVLVGNPKEDVLLFKNNYWKILRKQLVVTGSWNSSFNDNNNDWIEVLKYMVDDLNYFENFISREFSLKDGKEAFDYLMDKKIDKWKVVFRNEE